MKTSQIFKTAELQQKPSNNKKQSSAKPQGKPQPKVQNPPKAKVEITPEVAALQKQIEAQGQKVREIKGKGADKSVVDAEVKVLLDLKSKLPPELRPQPSGKKGKKK